MSEADIAKEADLPAAPPIAALGPLASMKRDPSRVYLTAEGIGDRSSSVTCLALSPLDLPWNAAKSSARPVRAPSKLGAAAATQRPEAGEDWVQSLVNALYTPFSMLLPAAKAQQESEQVDGQPDLEQIAVQAAQQTSAADLPEPTEQAAADDNIVEAAAESRALLVGGSGRGKAAGEVVPVPHHLPAIKKPIHKRTVSIVAVASPLMFLDHLAAA